MTELAERFKIFISVVESVMVKVCDRKDHLRTCCGVRFIVFGTAEFTTVFRANEADVVTDTFPVFRIKGAFSW